VVDLVQQMWSKFLRFTEMVLDSVERGVTFQRLQRDVEDELNELGRLILQWAIEGADERLCENADERKDWVIARRGDVKEILTSFGMMSYRRTYFRHKRTGRHRYLADEQVGIRPHQRIDTGLKGTLVERAVEASYHRSGKWHKRHKSWNVSGQTVMKAIREVELSQSTWEPPEKKRRVPYLFIQADEDHVGNQDGPRWHPRLVTVHEGVEGPSWRKRLINAQHFGGLYSGRNEALWHEVWQYLEATYDLEHVAAILVSGDGAAWIRAGCEYIPGSVFVLDRYHASKYVTKAAANDAWLYGRLWRALEDGDRRGLRAMLHEAAQKAETDNRRMAIEDCLRYLDRNWDGIMAWQTFRDVWPGCSAEGHVSHVYAARMSSRPMAWRCKGVDQMSRMRVMAANGKSVREVYVSQKTQGLPPLRLKEERIQELRRLISEGRSLRHMVTYRLPGLEGCSPALRRILKAVVYGC
jgi:Uncharacterised protein family (UPF0236).